MAQLLTRLTLGFGSGHDLMVHGFEPHVGVRSLLGILSLSLSLSLSLTRAHFLLLCLSK